MNTIQVDIWSDIACPWCYVGETSFKMACEKFLKENPNTEIKTTFHAYMIDKNTKKDGEDYLEYNQRRWGGDGWTFSLKNKGKQYGCNFGNWKTWPNTFLAHTLMAEAKKHNKGSEVLEDIFFEQYENGKNVSLESVLNEIGNKHGISGWNTNENQQKVNEDDTEGKQNRGISGVPYFIIGNNQTVIEGAASPNEFIQALKKNIHK